MNKGVWHNLLQHCASGFEHIPLEVALSEQPGSADKDWREAQDYWMAKILAVFIFLQMADFMTTVATLRLGGAEMNPLVHLFMSIGPIAGLILAKTAVIAVAIGCFFLNKPQVLHRANLVFAGIVLWNVSIIARLLG